MFKKLTQEDNSYHINKKSPFIATLIPPPQIMEVFNFSYQMTFGNTGEHRSYRSGGQYSRKNGELFCNTFQGKLAEFAVFNQLVKMGFTLERPDLSTWSLGKWDDTDLIIGTKKLSVKSAAFFSNLLLLEVLDFDNNGIYLPNNTNYDFTLLVRINPDIKKIFRDNRLLFSNEISKEKLEKIVLTKSYTYDIPGFITNQDLKHLIGNNFILPQNSLLNGKIKMDASNYYIQSGDLRELVSIIGQIK